MKSVMKWYDYTPSKRGGNHRQGERQIMVAHGCRGDRKYGYWRVVLGTAISAEILEWAGKDYNVRFGRNELTDELFVVIFKGKAVANASKKELGRSGRLSFACKAMYESFCQMMRLNSKKTNRLYFDLSENCANTTETLSYKILPF